MVYVDDDFEHVAFRCSACGLEDHDLADVAESQPWTVGARAVLPDETETHIEAIGPDRIMGNHREPTAVCAGATYLVRDLRPIDGIHADRLVLSV